jgi:hypothetical protein
MSTCVNAVASTSIVIGIKQVWNIVTSPAFANHPIRAGVSSLNQRARIDVASTVTYANPRFTAQGHHRKIGLIGHIYVLREMRIIPCA